MRPLERFERESPRLQRRPRWMSDAVMAAAAAIVLVGAMLFQLAPDRTGTSGSQLDADWASLAGGRIGPDEQAAIAVRAQAALRRFPLKANALSLLASLRQAQGRESEADKLFRATATLSHREVQADLWLFQRAMTRRRYAEAFQHADALLRREPGVRAALFPPILDSTRDPLALTALLERLAYRPDWRRPFFSMGFQGPRPQRMATIFWALQDAGSTASKDEVEAYLASLVARGRYEEAYVGWTLFIPGAQLTRINGVFDGGFSGQQTFAPFGWRIETNEAGAAAIGPGEGDGESVLQVTRFGAQTQFFARQLLVLAPGGYEVSVRGRAWGAPSDGTLEWSVRCAEDGPILASAPVSLPAGPWRTMTLRFTIPASGCPGQVLKLAGLKPGSPAEPQVWFDDVTLSQTAAAVP